MMNAVIVADNGRKVGLGHLGRCMALAQAIEERRGFKPVFMNLDPMSIEWIHDKGFSTISSNHKSWDLVIGDSYRFKPAELKAMRASAGTLLFLDDLGEVPAPCDWVLNSSIAANNLSYARARASGFLLGPKFHPLRREFRSARVPRVTRQDVGNVLITLGGGDGWGILKKVVIIAREALPEATLHVVVGPLVPNGSEIRGDRIVVHHPSCELPQLMAECDIAISGGGQTLYELAFMGLPTVATLLADNQKYIVEGFGALGIILSAGSPKKGDFPEVLKRNLGRLSRGLALRSRMAAVGQGLIDGNGAQRVADVLLGTGKAKPEIVHA